MRKSLYEKLKFLFVIKMLYSNFIICLLAPVGIFRFCIKNFTFFIFPFCFNGFQLSQPEKARLERKTSVKKSFFMSQSHDKIVFAENLSGFKKPRKCEGSKYLLFFFIKSVQWTITFLQWRLWNFFSMPYLDTRTWNCEVMWKPKFHYIIW